MAGFAVATGWVLEKTCTPGESLAVVGFEGQRRGGVK